MYTDNTLLRFETLALFFLSLTFGMALLRIRDFVFGEDVCNSDSGIKHIDFKKKIEEEEEANLDELFKGRGSNFDGSILRERK